MTGLQKTKAIGRLALKTAQAICKSLPLKGDYDNIYPLRMPEKILHYDINIYKFKEE